MKTIHFVAAIAAAFSFVGAAHAAPAAINASTGHYEWHQTPSYGPRAPVAAPRRVWVSNGAQMASCSCDMMRTRTADCMMAMPDKASPPVSAG